MGEIEDVMTLLAISVLADGRVADEEIEVFKKAVTQVPLSGAEIEVLTEAQVMSWFYKYYQDIRKIAFGPQTEFEERLTDLLDRLAPHIRQDALIHTLEMISISDGEVHEHETRLITFIKNYWHMA